MDTIASLCDRYGVDMDHARHVATLKALVEAGANPNLADRSGTTPLGLARSRGYREMVAILERAGAR